MYEAGTRAARRNSLRMTGKLTGPTVLTHMRSAGRVRCASATIPSGGEEVLIREAVADVAGEVLALGFGSEEVAELLRRGVEVAVELAATKTQVERALEGKVRG